MNTITERQILTPVEVGEALGVSAGRVHQMIRAGELPHIKVGIRAVRIPRAAFEEWLAAQNDQARASVRPAVQQ